MAEEKPEEQDSSMEEILQSIRKIIADEGDAAPAAPAAAPPAVEAGPAGSDVLELTEMVKDDGSVESLKEGEAVDVLASIDSALEAPPPAAETPVAAAPRAATPAPTVEAPMDSDDERLLSQEAEDTAKAAFKKLSQSKEKPRARVGGPRFRSGTTLEDLVVETLKPLVKEWLDTNLPTIVEDAVEREVRRIAG